MVKKQKKKKQNAQESEKPQAEKKDEIKILRPAEITWRTFSYNNKSRTGYVDEDNQIYYSKTISGKIKYVNLKTLKEIDSKGVPVDAMRYNESALAGIVEACRQAAEHKMPRVVSDTLEKKISGADAAVTLMDISAQRKHYAKAKKRYEKELERAEKEAGIIRKQLDVYKLPASDLENAKEECKQLETKVRKQKKEIQKQEKKIDNFMRQADKHRKQFDVYVTQPEKKSVKSKYVTELEKKLDGLAPESKTAEKPEKKPREDAKAYERILEAREDNYTVHTNKLLANKNGHCTKTAEALIKKYGLKGDLAEGVKKLYAQMPEISKVAATLGELGLFSISERKSLRRPLDELVNDFCAESAQYIRKAYSESCRMGDVEAFEQAVQCAKDLAKDFACICEFNGIDFGSGSRIKKILKLNRPNTYKLAWRMYRDLVLEEEEPSTYPVVALSLVAKSEKS